MIDYTNTQIVEYAQSDLTFNEAYPSILRFLYNGTYVTSSFPDGVSYFFDMRITTSVLPNDHEWIDELDVQPAIYAFLVRQVGDIHLTKNEALSIVGVCYYVFTPRNLIDGTLQGSYLRLQSKDIEGIYNPFEGNFGSVEGNDIFLLYNLGEKLVSSGSLFSDILSIEIHGTNLLTLLFSGGFLAYVGWVILKWAIPV